jgi:integrase
MDAPRSSERAVAWDVPDLIDWMLGTGMRIGEACAVRDDVLDLEAGTVEVNATVVRVKGLGLVVQTRPKTAAGWRVLALPPDLVAMVKRRRSELRVAGPDVITLLDEHGRTRQRRNPGVLLYSPTGQLRDPRNTNRDLRATLDGIDCDACAGTGYQLDDDGRVLRDDKGTPLRCDAGPFGWVHSHTFRKTVATRMEEAGCTPREVADQLGHARPSMTQDVYMSRGQVHAEVADVLDLAAGITDE